MVKKKKIVDHGPPPQQFGPPSRFEVQRGQVVKSIAGRDKGHCYLVIGREGEFLYLVDGRKRSLENPKKKNIRHVQKINRIAADPIERDEKIRAELKEGAYV